jgi:hypothetical protein
VTVPGAIWLTSNPVGKVIVTASLAASPPGSENANVYDAFVAPAAVLDEVIVILGMVWALAGATTTLKQHAMATRRPTSFLAMQWFTMCTS